MLIALDRQEKGKGDLSAIQEVERDFNAPVISIVGLDEVITYLQHNPDMDEYLDAVAAYREAYGVS